MFFKTMQLRSDLKFLDKLDYLDYNINKPNNNIHNIYKPN